MTPFERIAHRVNRNGDVNDPETPRPLLTLNEFFEGNDVAGSIACNIAPDVTPAEVHLLLRRIASRRDVADVRVEIAMFDAEWPFSDTVWLITDADTEQVVKWFGELTPAECWTGWTEGVAFEACPVPDGMRPVACWWD
jgi:hypothetical protein